MKYIIKESGMLSIERSGIFIDQLCSYKHETFCGHWCPHFGEPKYNEDQVILSLCSGTNLFCDKEDFTDLRGQLEKHN